MSSEDPTDDESSPDEADDTTDSTTDSSDVRERLEHGADRAVEGFDEGVVDLLSWVLETETRARIYVHLRKHPDSTSDEVAEGTGLYPSTVREALAEMHADGTVERDKRESDGAGNNPFEYRAIRPSALVRDAVEEIQTSLNDVFQLDRYMGGEDTSDQEPVTITVEEEDDRDEDEEWGEPAGPEGEDGSDVDETEVEESDADEDEPEDDSSDDEPDEEVDDGQGEEQDEGQDGEQGEEQDEDIDESL